MTSKVKAIAKRIPVVRFAAAIVRTKIKIPFLGSKEYWETRYATGGNSGAGSYGNLAEFKAEIVNSFVQDNNVNSVIEFGCGDGNQLLLFDFPNYVGLDVSRTAIKLCMSRFERDETKSFFLYDPECFEDNNSIFKAETALSLDVIYHLVEDGVFELYMKHLFSGSDKFVIVYSTDTDINAVLRTSHIKNRQFSKWVEHNLSDWKLIRRIKNRFPNESACDFFIYQKEK